MCIICTRQCEICRFKDKPKSLNNATGVISETGPEHSNETEDYFLTCKFDSVHLKMPNVLLESFGTLICFSHLLNSRVERQIFVHAGFILFQFFFFCWAMSVLRSMLPTVRPIEILLLSPKSSFLRKRHLWIYGII